MVFVWNWDFFRRMFAKFITRTVTLLLTFSGKSAHHCSHWVTKRFLNHIHCNPIHYNPIFLVQRLINNSSWLDALCRCCRKEQAATLYQNIRLTEPRLMQQYERVILNFTKEIRQHNGEMENLALAVKRYSQARTHPGTHNPTSHINTRLTPCLKHTYNIFTLRLR